jgi:SAM-dependent methyltransferase
LLEVVALPGVDSIAKLAERTDGPKILDTDAFSAVFRVLQAAPYYLSSSYRPELPAGASLNPKVVNVDLMKMPFTDGCYDVIMTSDVMEHVHRDGAAHREIHRCLKPGGYYIFTVPYVPGWELNQIRIDTSGDEDVVLMEKQYHGDPLNKNGVLVYRIYGRELQAQLDAIGFDVLFMDTPEPEYAILTKDVFICRKRA